MKILSRIVSSFFNLWYKVRPPEMVEYWKRGDKARARVVEREDGSYAMEIEGEKRVYPGFPRGHVLTGSFAKLKKGLKHHLLNTGFAVMEKMDKDSRIDMLPPEKMAPAVRHIWETFEKLEHCEVVPDMKARIALIKRIMCQVIQEDDAYRFRAQLFLWLIDQKKVRMSKDDMYYARGKYFRPDRFTKIGNKVLDKFTY